MLRNNSESKVKKTAIDELYNIFAQFATFGVSRPQMGDSKHLSLDNAKFAKFCKDCRIINKRCTLIDVDIIFKKVVEKGKRRLDWKHFLVAVQELADLKEPGHSDPEVPFNNLLGQIIDKRPSINGTVAAAPGVFDKLTDSSLYTGTHKHRFDSKGHGLGLDGRDRPGSTITLDKLVNRDMNGNMPDSTNHSTRTRSGSSTTTTSSPNTSSGVFSRLTDSSRYPRSYKSKHDPPSTRTFN